MFAGVAAHSPWRPHSVLFPYLDGDPGAESGCVTRIPDRSVGVELLPRSQQRPSVLQKGAAKGGGRRSGHRNRQRRECPEDGAGSATWHRASAPPAPTQQPLQVSPGGQQRLAVDLLQPTQAEAPQAIGVRAVGGDAVVCVAPSASWSRYGATGMMSNRELSLCARAPCAARAFPGRRRAESGGRRTPGRGGALGDTLSRRCSAPSRGTCRSGRR